MNKKLKYALLFMALGLMVLFLTESARASHKTDIDEQKRMEMIWANEEDPSETFPEYICSYDYNENGTVEDEFVLKFYKGKTTRVKEDCESFNDFINDTEYIVEWQGKEYGFIAIQLKDVIKIEDMPAEIKDESRNTPEIYTKKQSVEITVLLILGLAALILIAFVLIRKGINKGGKHGDKKKNV